MRLTITAIALPPPHLARPGVPPERFTKTVDEGTADAACAEFLREAIRTGVFRAGGCVNVTIQREAIRPEGRGPCS